MPLQKREVEALWKGLRNGLQYGSKVRFVHTLVMTLLFKDIKLKELVKTVKTILKMAFEHGKNLGLFVFSYKAVTLLLKTLYGDYSANHLLAGALCGGIVFGRKKSPVNHQIVMYLLSRNIVGLISLAYKKLYPSRWLQKSSIPFERKYGYMFLAALCWGTVMWLFQVDKSVLQPSLKFSMDFLYVQSDQKLNSMTELIPYYPKNKEQAKDEKKLKS